jgi:hypothetical protein
MTSIIAFISILGYIASLGIGLYRVYVSVSERKFIAGQEFYTLLEKAGGAAEAGNFMDDAFRETLRDLVIGSQTLQGLSITGPVGNEFSFEREQGAVISWTADIPRFKTKFGISHEPFFAPLQIEGIRNVTVSAVASYIHYPSLIETLKLSLIIIVASLGLSVLALIIDAARAPKAPAPILPKGGLKAGRSKPKPKQPEGEEDFEIRSGEAPPLVSPEFRIDGIVSEVPGEIRQEEGTTETPEAEDSAAILDQIFKQMDISPAPAESGLSPAVDSRVSEWLASALRKAEAAERDLVFMMMEISEPGEVFRRMKEMAAEFFPPPALILEQSERCLALIVPEQGLEQGFDKAEKFHTVIFDFFPGILLKRTDFRIGLSARTGRQINAERLAQEAAKALKKTLEDNAPLVAFKSDPEKYKAFLNRQKTASTPG